MFDPVGLLRLPHCYSVHPPHELVFGGTLGGIAQSIAPARAA